MYAEVGVIILCVTALLGTVLLLAFRNPNPPRWTKWSMVGESLAALIVAGLVFGVGLLAKFATNFETQTFGLQEALVTIAALVVTYFLFQRLGVRRKLAEFRAAAEGATGKVTMTPGAPQATGVGTSRAAVQPGQSPANEPEAPTPPSKAAGGGKNRAA
ncbi:MAG: hypothetical protein HY521_10880 [Proteobacteria bacterium]|nr:hypothetical protein [Pseudomonadota bacterium]